MDPKIGPGSGRNLDGVLYGSKGRTAEASRQSGNHIRTISRRRLTARVRSRPRSHSTACIRFWRHLDAWTPGRPGCRPDRWPADAWMLASGPSLLVTNTTRHSRPVSEKALAAGSVSRRRCDTHSWGGPEPSQRFAAFLSTRFREFAARAKEQGRPRTFNIPVAARHHLRHLEGRYRRGRSTCYREALDLLPQQLSQFLNNMAWTLSQGLKRYPRRRSRYIEEAIRTRRVSFPQHLDTRGVIEERLGQYDLAIADLKKAIEGNPSGETYFHLAKGLPRGGQDAREPRISRSGSEGISRPGDPGPDRSPRPQTGPGPALIRSMDGPASRKWGRAKASHKNLEVWSMIDGQMTDVHHGFRRGRLIPQKNRRIEPPIDAKVRVRRKRVCQRASQRV